MQILKVFALIGLLGVVLAGCVVHPRAGGWGDHGRRWGWHDRGDHHHGHHKHQHPRHWRR